MRFIDETVVRVKAGNGGDGVATFITAAFAPKGGPDGGNGGKGGSVIFKASQQTGTLAKVQRHTIKAKNGANGQQSKRSGRAGKNVYVKVPLGTIIINADTDEIIADLIAENETVIVAQGGNGGRGNMNFASPVNRAPRRCEPGRKGEEFRLRLEMKLLADVGLVGLPNAGKSTLLSALSRAKPIIGSFPFSTLTPALGVVNYGIYQRFTVADLPGLIAGAADGKGLGHQFLRHVERTKLLVFLVDTADKNYYESYQTLWAELDSFNNQLSKLPRLIIKSKSDLDNSDVVADEDNGSKLEFNLTISSVSGDGILELIDLIAKHLGLIEGM